jgi:hypothetical protein
MEVIGNFVDDAVVCTGMGVVIELECKVSIENVNVHC